MTLLKERVWPPTLPQLFILVFAIFGLLVALVPLSDNSAFLHLQTGRLILRTGEVPMHDPYSFTAAGTPWVVQSWLASLLYGLAYEAGGLRAFAFLNGVLTLAAALLILRIAWGSAPTPARSVIAAMIALACGSQLWSQRPLLFGVICFALLVLHVQRNWPLWVVPLLVILWLNTHGSYPLGLGWLALTTIGARIDGRAWPIGHLKRIGVFAATLILLCVVPLERKLVTFPVVLLERPEVFDKVVEWMSPDFHDPFLRSILVALAMALVFLARGELRWALAIPTAVFFALGLWSTRNFAVLPVVLAGSLGATLSSKLPEVREWSRPRAHSLVAIVLLVGGGAFAGVRLADARVVDDEAYPVKAVTFLEKQGKVDRRIALNEIAGAYILLRYDAQYKVWFDDRFDMYPVEFMKDQDKLYAGTAGALAVLDNRRAEVVLWKRTAPLTALLARDRRWKRLYKDRDYVIYERREALPS